MHLPRSVKSIIIYGVGFSSLRMLIGALSVVYMLHMGVGIKDVGFLKSYQFLLILLLDFPLSYVADKYSRKFSIILAGFLAGAYLLVMGFSESLLMFFVAETLNALSLLFFGGAYISYLIETNSKAGNSISAQKIIGVESKYSYLLAAFAGVFGASFVSVDSNFIWLLSGAVLLFWSVTFAVTLPSDRASQAPKPQESAKGTKKHPFLEFKSDMMLIFSHIRGEMLKVTIALLSISVLMQIIIQLWQTFIKSTTESSQGFIYAVAMGVIFAAQSLSGLVASRKKPPRLLGFALFTSLLFVALSGYVENVFLSAALLILCLGALFFVTRLALIIISGKFHDSIKGDHSNLRASFDSVVSVGVKTLLIVLFPLSTFLLESFGLFALMGMLAVLSMAYSLSSL